MNVAKKLVGLRKEKGITQAGLAEKMNVSRQAVSRWETGESIPTMENLISLSEFYGVSLGYFTGAEERAPQKEHTATTLPRNRNSLLLALLTLMTLIIVGLIGLCIHLAKSDKQDSIRMPVSEMEQGDIEVSSQSTFDFEW